MRSGPVRFGRRDDEHLSALWVSHPFLHLPQGAAMMNESKLRDLEDAGLWREAKRWPHRDDEGYYCETCEEYHENGPCEQEEAS